jgi:hypothetical protein
VVRAGPVPLQGRRAVLGPAPGPSAPLPRSAAAALPVPGGLGMAPDIPAAATATPARPPTRRPRAITENRLVTTASLITRGQAGPRATVTGCSVSA